MHFLKADFPVVEDIFAQLQSDYDNSVQQANLKGLDMRTCILEGASLHGAKIAGTYFPDVLTPEEVRDLADGSVFSAKEAHDKGLVDQIGYLDDAIRLIQSLAGVSGAQVVEYQQVLSLSSILGVRTQAPIKIDRNTLHELSALQVLYLWSAF